MISPRLAQIQRQLSRSASKGVEHDDGDSNSFMEAVEETINRKTQAQIQAAKERVEKAEADTAKVREQLASVQKELVQAHETANRRVEGIREESKKEMEKMCGMHKVEMQQMKDDMVSLRRELASEQQAKARAEAKLEEAGKLQAHLEKMVAAAKVAPAAPVVQNITPVATPTKGATATVTQRDQNGRIVSFTLTPST